MVPAAIIVLVVFFALIGWNIALRIENGLLKKNSQPKEGNK